MECISQFKAIYQHLDAKNIDLLDSIYTQEIRFVDPLHSIEGLPRLKAYCRELYSNVGYCGFVFGDEIIHRHEAYLQWVMEFSHPRLNGGGAIFLPGVSCLKFADKVSFHRDYYDAGAMLYEHIPVMGSIVRWLKRRLQS